MEECSKLGVNVLLVQEPGVTKSAIGVVASHAVRCGWQLVGATVPAKAPSRGGLLALVREPLALVAPAIVDHGDGQAVFAAVLGLNVSLHVPSVYRHRWATEAFENVLEEQLVACGANSWVLGADLNSDAHGSSPAAMLEQRGGALIAAGMHDRGVHPIDGMWVGGALGQAAVGGVVERMGVADHAALGTELDTTLAPALPVALRPLLPCRRPGGDRLRRRPDARRGHLADGGRHKGRLGTGHPWAWLPGAPHSGCGAVGPC